MNGLEIITNNEQEYELNDEARDTMQNSFGKGKSGLQTHIACYEEFCINPNGKFYRWWVNIIFLWSIYSSFFTPLEFGFFEGLPKHMEILDCMQIVFLIDVIIQFFVAYRDEHTYKMVHDRGSIAVRYGRTSFPLDILGCFPWDGIYKATGRSECIRYFVWIRLYRTRNILQFFKKMEKDIRINYLFTRIVKLITVELYCTHTAACIFYYLATTLPPSQEGNTWIGSLRLGDYQYINFREIDFWTRYITSAYFAIVTMATVGECVTSFFLVVRTLHPKNGCH